MVQSGGQVGPGGHVIGGVGAKGKYHPANTPPGRLWAVTGGIGANAKTAPGYGSEGAPVKYSSQPFVCWQPGRHFAPLVLSYAI